MNEFILSSEILTEFELESPKEYKVKAIVLLVENNRLNEGYSLNMFGKQMKDWVKDTVSHFDCRFVSLSEKDNPLEVIKPFITDEDFTIVLFSDTPLLTSNTVLETLDYATTKNLDFCKLPRGFIINSKNYLYSQLTSSAEPAFVNKDEFFVVFDCKTLSMAESVLKNRIIDKHLKNKVIIHDVNSTYIEASVEIESNVEIFANNVLKGLTKIEEGVVLKENNIIEDSVVLKGSEVVSSVLKNTKVLKESKIGPFKFLQDNKGDKK